MRCSGEWVAFLDPNAPAAIASKQAAAAAGRRVVGGDDNVDDEEEAAAAEGGGGAAGPAVELPMTYRLSRTGSASPTLAGGVMKHVSPQQADDEIHHRVTGQGGGLRRTLLGTSSEDEEMAGEEEEEEVVVVGGPDSGTESGGEAALDGEMSMEMHRPPQTPPGPPPPGRSPLPDQPQPPPQGLEGEYGQRTVQSWRTEVEMLKGERDAATAQSRQATAELASLRRAGAVFEREQRATRPPGDTRTQDEGWGAREAPRRRKGRGSEAEGEQAEGMVGQLLFADATAAAADHPASAYGSSGEEQEQESLVEVICPADAHEGDVVCVTSPRALT